MSLSTKTGSVWTQLLFHCNS